MQTKSSQLEIVKPERVKLRIKYGEGASDAKFSKGKMVEVRSDEEGFQGSWYTAVVVDSVANGKFLVQYQTLKTDDETELLKEYLDASYIRPCPPEIPQIGYFEQSQEVDAWYNDGWWVGRIFKVLDDYRYIVHFGCTNDEMTVEHSKLRPHQMWIDGRWIAASVVRLPVGSSSFLFSLVLLRLVVISIAQVSVVVWSKKHIYRTISFKAKSSLMN